MFTTQGKSQVYHVTNVLSQPIPRKAENNKHPKGGMLRQGKILLHARDQAKILSKFMLFFASVEVSMIQGVHRPLYRTETDAPISTCNVCGLLVPSETSQLLTANASLPEEAEAAVLLQRPSPAPCCHQPFFPLSSRKTPCKKCPL